MIHGNVRVPTPINEPVLSYAPGTPERATVKKALEQLTAQKLDIPIVIGGKEIRTGKITQSFSPHRHQHVTADVHQASASHVEQAIAAAMAAKKDWEATPFNERAAIFLRAAELLATKYRPIINAATMLGQSKTVYQAEIDAACEAIDFLRFNVAFAQTLMEQQPISSAGVWNQTDYRALDGFVFAVELAVGW